MRAKIIIFWSLIIAFILGVSALFTAVSLDWLGPLPSIEELQNPTSQMSSAIYSEDGVLLGKYYQRDRLATKYKDISPFVLNALVATEDVRFFEHSGIDLRALGRALWGVFTLNSKGGASTLSQQLALNLLVEIDEQNRRAASKFQRILQKLKEWVVAVKLERNFTKQEILALYLNTVPFGDNVYGIKNAAATFFQKSPANLNLEEAAVLIGMLKGNTLYNPRKNPKRAIERRNTVIDQMYVNGLISYGQSLEAKQKAMVIRYMRLDEQNGLATYFREVVREEMKTLLKGIRKSDGRPYDLYKDGIKIYTTIDSKMQAIAEQVVETQLGKLQEILNNQATIKNGSVWLGKEQILWNLAKSTKRWQYLADLGFSEQEIQRNFKEKIKMRVFARNKAYEQDTLLSPLDSIKYHQQFLQNGFVVMDPNTGFVKVWVGGINYKYFKFDHININTKRQVGSAIKPLLYALSIMDLGYGPNTICPNVEQCFPEYDNWCSHNNDNTSSDNVPLARGLASSLNNVSAFLIKQLTPRRFVEFLRSANIHSALPAVPSLALGTADISPLEMLGAYSIFPANGYSVRPTYIKRVEDRNGNVLKTFRTEKNYVISNVDAYTMTQMLRNVVDHGTAVAMRSKYQVKGAVAGKTGTTNDNADAWFIGFTPNLLGVCWVGCDMRFISITSSLGYGGSAAMPVFANFLNELKKVPTTLDTTAKDFVMPADYHQRMHASSMAQGNDSVTHNSPIPKNPRSEPQRNPYLE